MSRRVSPDQLTHACDDVRLLTERTFDPHDHLKDEQLAAESSARLLIAASTRREVETIARRIHAAGVRAALPFVQISAGHFPLEPRMLGATCIDLLEAAAGGTLLISDIEEMPAIVQDLLFSPLADLESAAAPMAGVRVVCGTTVPLFDRLASGTFSERLFYRVNTIQLGAPDATPEPDTAARGSESSAGGTPEARAPATTAGDPRGI